MNNINSVLREFNDIERIGEDFGVDISELGEWDDINGPVWETLQNLLGMNVDDAQRMKDIHVYRISVVLSSILEDVAGFDHLEGIFDSWCRDLDSWIFIIEIEDGVCIKFPVFHYTEDVCSFSEFEEFDVLTDFEDPKVIRTKELDTDSSINPIFSIV